MTELADDVLTSLMETVRLRGVGASEEINPFWRTQLETFRALLNGQDEIAVDELRAALGYNPKGLPEGVTTNRDLPEWPLLMAAIEKNSVEGLWKGWAEHAGSLHFLNVQRVLDDYLAWADAHGLHSGMNLARLYWYWTKVRRVLAARGRSHPQVLLEIGAGSGQLAVMLAEAGLVRHYVIVDLPEMLLNVMLLVREKLPQAQVRLNQAPDVSLAGPVFWLLETGNIRKTPDRCVDMALNIQSFMEMDPDVRDFYIEEIYRTAAPGALFYNVNRRQVAMTRRDGTPYESNPLLYPYRASDRVIEWQPDEFQQSYRARVFESPFRSFAISRIAEIGPGPGD